MGSKRKRSHNSRSSHRATSDYASYQSDHSRSSRRKQPNYKEPSDDDYESSANEKLNGIEEEDEAEETASQSSDQEAYLQKRGSKRPKRSRVFEEEEDSAIHEDLDTSVDLSFSNGNGTTTNGTVNGNGTTDHLLEETKDATALDNATDQTEPADGSDINKSFTVTLKLRSGAARDESDQNDPDDNTKLETPGMFVLLKYLQLY